jgi:hypothetical protein
VAPRINWNHEIWRRRRSKRRRRRFMMFTLSLFSIN